MPEVNLIGAAADPLLAFGSQVHVIHAANCSLRAAAICNAAVSILMRDRSIGLFLRIVHLAVFVALALQGLLRRVGGSLRGKLNTALHALGLASISPSSQPKRGKQPKAPQCVAVILADDDSNSVPLQKLADVLSWCGAH